MNTNDNYFRNIAIKILLGLNIFLFLFAVIKLSTYSDNTVTLENNKDSQIGNYDILTAESRPMPQADNDSKFDTYLEAYFNNLNSNFGANQIGSCGYVAIGMLLSYYDSYLNDDIIPDDYDIQVRKGTSARDNIFITSPGVRHDMYNLMPVFNNNYLPRNEDYYQNHVLATESTSFHSKIIKMGKDYFNLYDFDAEDPCGTTHEERIAILEKYLNVELNYFKNVDYSLITYKGSSSKVKQHIINEIDEGRTVIVRVKGKDSNNNEISHACIAYAYEGDSIICHMGWSGFSRRVLPEENGYTSFEAAISINFDKNHTHSNNYVYKKVEYCYCDHRIITYKEINYHAYTDKCVKYDENQHKLMCVCGAYELQAHEWTQYVPLLSINGDKTAEAQTIEPNALGGGMGTYIQCKKCYFRKKLGDGEVIILPGHGISKPEEEEE